MVDNNYNINPTESSPTIAGLTHTKHRQEKKKRQNLNEKENKQGELVEDELNESGKEKIDNEITENKENKHFIDYCA